MYEPRYYSPTTTHILLVHGAASNRSWWNGGAAGPLKGGSVGRYLAALGAAAVAIDKIGYGQSPYTTGPGFAISPFTQIGMMHEVVTQLRNGSYTVTTSACPSGTRATVAARKVALMGHSIGGGESMNYAGTYHDIDAVIPIAWTNAGLPSTVQFLFGTNVIPQVMSGRDYVNFFAPGASGISQQCIDSIFYLPGSLPSVYNAECANQNMVQTPAGELLAAGDLIGANFGAIPNVGATPALLVFGDNDKFVTDADNNTGDPDLVKPEIDYWKANCNCDVDKFIQPKTGHAAPLHLSSSLLAIKARYWLRSKGL